jgi:carboxypeptidase C (cathepsin A)
MKSFLAVTLAALLTTTVHAAPEPEKTAPDAETVERFEADEVRSSGSVTVGGVRIPYQAVAGTLVVHPKDWDDVPARDEEGRKNEKTQAEASMFYVAYFRNGVPAASRPITFVFNGGPGSSSIWLHMGAFGPLRVETGDAGKASAAPYAVVNNDEALLDASDLVFIDAPGTGFSRVAGKDKDKAFYGVDQDIHAFARFIVDFLSKHGRWSSPKYLFGESYGTMRAAGLAKALQDQDVDLNGVILLSDILNWDLVPDDPQLNPSVDLPYVVSLPTYAATAWYHHRVANRPEALEPFLAEVERFATTDYALALMQGAALPAPQRQAIAEKLAGYTGLSVAYLLRTNLRIEYGALQKELLQDRDLTTGTLDTRFTGWTIDPLSKVADYDPQGSAIGAAYAGAFNDYVRGGLHYGDGRHYQTSLDVYGSWDYKHQPPGAGKPLIALPNVLPDLAVAMKRNPTMKIMVNGGYFDVSTPYYAGRYELQHLPVPAALHDNIEYRYYPSGHMVYLHRPSLKALHDNVADFIRRSDNIAER